MQNRVNYNNIIEDIKKSSDLEYRLDQNKAKKIGGNELPKSCFEEHYYRSGKNELMRYLKNTGYNVEFVKPEIIIHKDIK